MSFLISISHLLSIFTADFIKIRSAISSDGMSLQDDFQSICLASEEALHWLKKVLGLPWVNLTCWRSQPRTKVGRKDESTSLRQHWLAGRTRQRDVILIMTFLVVGRCMFRKQVFTELFALCSLTGVWTSGMALASTIAHTEGDSPHRCARYIQSKAVLTRHIQLIISGQ